MNTLFLDTSDNKKTIVRLTIDGNVFEKIHDEPKHRSSQIVLILLVEIIKEAGLTIEDIDTIAVNVGPGSYTGTRVGVSIANALSLALGKPINNKNLSELENPVY